MDEYSLKKIEYNEILRMVAEETGSEIGKEKALELMPSCDLYKTRTSSG